MADQPEVSTISSPEDELDQIRVRREKLQAWRAAGIEPFGARYEVTSKAEQISAGFDQLEGQDVRLAGRLRSMRRQGKASFADLQDESGTIQLFFRANQLGEEAYERLSLLDLGDIVGVAGVVMKTRRGEISVEVREYSPLSKSLRPLPEKWHGLKDVEQRYRRRYLDLIVNPESRRTFMLRSRVITGMRRYLDDEGYLEVETPMLHPIAGGASARPFVTHHNALDMPLYLRIAPELYLKRLLVGGIERVFEIGKTFRNEGIDTRHNPEFTLMECYAAYEDADYMMSLTESMIASIAQSLHGDTVIAFQGERYDLTPPWPRLPMLDALAQHAGVDLLGVDDAEQARRIAADAGVSVQEGATLGEVITEVFDERVEDKLTGPVFIVDYPIEISPLAKRHSADPRLADRFEAYVNGSEIANGYSELNDPLDQRFRFEQQMAAREAGDDEAHLSDEDFLQALEHGMPPAGGLGIGVDRLVMLLSDSPSMRDVLLFPHMRPRS